MNLPLKTSRAQFSPLCLDICRRASGLWTLPPSRMAEPFSFPADANGDQRNQSSFLSLAATDFVHLKRLLLVSPGKSALGAVFFPRGLYFTEELSGSAVRRFVVFPVWQMMLRWILGEQNGPKRFRKMNLTENPLSTTKSRAPTSAR